MACFSFADREQVRALLIDDDADDIAIIIRLAAKSKQLDIRLRACSSTEQAQTLMTDCAFDIVYIDYWLGTETSIPFISGFTKISDAPCVLLTGLDEPDIRRLAFRAGVKAFLSKEEISAQAIEGVTLAVLGGGARN